MNKKLRYQPDIATSTICWSFTFIILLFSLLLWLEITVLQIWTILVFLIFLITVFIQLFFRWIELTDERMIVHTVIPQNIKKIDLINISKVKMTRHGVVVKVENQKFFYFMNKNGREILYNLLLTTTNVR